MEVLEQLAADGYWRVRKVVAQHPQAPTEALNLLRRAGADRKLREIGHAPESLTGAERERLWSWGPYGRQLLAAHSDTNARQPE